MDENNEALTQGTALSSPGARLRAAREASGRTLEDMATLTRVPVRLIDALERDAYDEMPAGPYAIGFARALARTLGLNDQEIVASVRTARQQHGAGISAALEEYEPLDSGRVPGRTLAWTTAILAVLIIGGYVAWSQWSSTPSAPAEPAAAASSAATGTTPAAAATPAGVPAELANAPVKITASERVWFSLEDDKGKGQFDLTLQPGEFYTVKPEQRGLFLRTGRPQALRIVLGDKEVPQIAASDTVVSGIGLDAASLYQRINGQTPTAPAANGPAPVTTGTATTPVAATTAAPATAAGAR